jgi:predicted O-linked N-acetylglucosamine transferase (SPINDLY family)
MTEQPDPDNLRQAFRAAVERHHSGNLEAAAAAYRAILTAEPAHAGALHLIGVIAGQRGDHRGALAWIEESLRHDPLSPEAHHNLGFNFERLGDFAQACDSYRRALALRPDYVEARNNLGNVLGELGQWHEAIEHYERVLARDPANAAAYNNLGNALLNQRRPSEAVAAYRRAVELRPDHVNAHSNLLLALNYDPQVEPEQLFAEHRRWAAAHAPPAFAVNNPRGADDPHRRLRIGYVSGDFWRHAVATFFEPLITHHDRSHFEVFCYANTMRIDEVTRRLMAAADHWVSIAEIGDSQAAEGIRRDGIDILVDLSGHTARNRLTLFGSRPAPVQVTWLGYPNTTGLDAMDYRLTDRIADPEGASDETYTEQLVRLERPFVCYRPPDEAPPVSAPPALTQDHVTFGSFNSLIKITPDVVRLWSRILSALPESRLFLKARQLADCEARTELLSQFAHNGIAADRLDLAPMVIAKVEHLDMYRRVDIGLDPFPYNGATTTCEALWMGVPVIVLRGKRHAARVGASLLTAVGLDELIAEDEDGYLQCAIGLARDRRRLVNLRFGLRDAMRGSPLCDAADFAVAVEGAYRSMWQAIFRMRLTR